jgi:hypothetical protein
MQDASECEAAASSERIGKFIFTVHPDEPTPESQARWNERIDALADLLLALWDEEQEQLHRQRLADIAVRN